MRHYIIIALSLLVSGPAYAISQPDMVLAVLGEAEGEPYAGKVALSYALINRGTLKGVFGHKAIKVGPDGLYRRKGRVIGQKAVLEAKKAISWALANPGKSPVGRARHWENIKAFGTPYWAKGRKPVAVIGSHAFYEGVK